MASASLVTSAPESSTPTSEAPLRSSSSTVPSVAPSCQEVTRSTTFWIASIFSLLMRGPYPPPAGATLATRATRTPRQHTARSWHGAGRPLRELHPPGRRGAAGRAAGRHRTGRRRGRGGLVHGHGPLVPDGAARRPG